jgi:hypothetical protein
MPFSNHLKFLVDDAWHGKRFGDLVKAPIGAMGGLSNEQGRQVAAALQVQTIGELATCRYVLWAQSITHLAKFERVDAFNPSLSAILDQRWEMKPLRTIVKQSPAVFTGLSDKDAELLATAISVRTVEGLATNRYVMTAQVIAHLAKYEATDEGMRKAA